MQSSVQAVLTGLIDRWLWPPAVLCPCGATKTPLIQQLPDDVPACRKLILGTKIL